MTKKEEKKDSVEKVVENVVEKVIKKSVEAPKVSVIGGRLAPVEPGGEIFPGKVE